MMCYPGTELWVPVLYGMEIPDPEGSGLMVPVLGVESDQNGTDATPLAGSMEDADGKGRGAPGAPESPGRENPADVSRGTPPASIHSLRSQNNGVTLMLPL